MKGMEPVRVELHVKKRKVCGSVSMAGVYVSQCKNYLNLVHWFTEELSILCDCVVVCVDETNCK